MIQQATASRRVQGGELRSSESSALSDNQTESPHSGQNRASRIFRRLYPQRRQGFSLAFGSLLIWTMRIARFPLNASALAEVYPSAGHGCTSAARARDAS